MRNIVIISSLFAAAGGAQPNCPPIRFVEAAQSRTLPRNGEIIFAVHDQGEYGGYRHATSPPYAIRGVIRGFGDDLSGCVPHRTGGGPAGEIATARRRGEPATLVSVLSDPNAPGSGVAAWTEFRSNTVGVFLENPDHSFRSRTAYSVGPFPQVLLNGDYNGDGRADLAVLYGGRVLSGARVEHGGISFLNGLADGGFANAVNVSVDGTAVGFAQHDLNGDSRIDFVVAHWSDAVTVGQTGAISAMLNTGPGAYAITELARIPFPKSVTIADVNGDGRLDIAVAAAGVPLLLGNGDGTFRAPANVAPVFDPSLVTTGDLNRDGVVDLIAADSLSGTVSVLLGRGAGAFAAPVTYAAGIKPVSLLITDFDGDGYPDVVVGDGTPEALTPAESEYLYVLFGHGDGTLAGAPYFRSAGQDAGALAVGDFNGDGRDDLAFRDGQRFAIYLAPSGQGAWTPRSAATAGTPRFARAADLNGDGRDDIAYVSSNSIAALLSNGDGTFRQAASRITVTNGTSVALGDFNRDGRIDAAVTGGGGVTIHLGGGDGTFQAGTAIPTGTDPRHVVAGDWNGDGADDLAVVNWGEFSSSTNPGNLTILVGNGNGTFRAPVRLEAGLNPTAVAAGDLDGDGNLDLAVVTGQPSFRYALFVYRGGGGGAFASPTANATEFGPVQLAIDDFSGDGRADVIVSHCCGSTLPGYYLGLGNGRLEPEAYFAGTAHSAELASGDFNGDGRPDLAIYSRPSSSSYGASVHINAAPAPAFASVTAAGFELGPVAPQSIVSAFGSTLAPSTEAAATLPLPTRLGGASLRVRDAQGAVHDGSLFFSSPSQINYLWPASSALGRAVVSIEGAQTQTATVRVARVAPGLFVANQQRLAAALVLRVRADGSQSVEPVAREENGAIVPATVDFGPESDQLYLLLFGTGFRLRGNLDQVKVLVGGEAVQPIFAGEQGEFEGLDQANIPLSRQFRGRGDVTVQLEVEGMRSNVTILRM